MKIRIIVGLAVIGLLFASGPVQAQLTGLPIGTDAAPGHFEDMSVSGHIVIGENFNLFGGRFSYRLYDQIKLFGGLGLADPDRGDMGYGLQGGVLYSLPPIPELPFDVALRGTLGYASLDQRFGGRKFSISITGINVGGLASYRIDDMFAVYGYLGLAMNRFSGSGGVSSTETDPAIGVGAQIDLSPQISLFGEVMHIDDAWFGFGGRFNF